MKAHLTYNDPLNNSKHTKVIRDHNGNIVALIELNKWYGVPTRDGKQYYKYIGVFDNIKDVPDINCLYVIGNSLYIRNITPNTNKNINNKQRAVKIDKDDALLPTTPNDEDNLLLLILKMVMKYRNLTENGFKDMFDSTSEMNNMKRLLFNGNGALSWQKFTSMTDKLNADVIVTVVDRDDNSNIIATNDQKDN